MTGALRARPGGPYLAGQAPRPLTRAPLRPFGSYVLRQAWEFTGGIDLRNTIEADPRYWRPRFSTGYDATAGISTLGNSAFLNPFFSAAYAAQQPIVMQEGGFDLVAKPTPAAMRVSGGGTVPDTYPYISGAVTNRVSFAQTYGFFEARIKFPPGKGFWPAFWMLPSDATWPPEIDIMEFLGIYPTRYHVGLVLLQNQADGNGTDQAWIETGVDLTASHHEYGCDWRADRIEFYFDRQKVASFATPASLVNRPMYLLLNLAVGGSWGGLPDNETPFPARMEVDWVRTWRLPA